MMLNRVALSVLLSLLLVSGVQAQTKKKKLNREPNLVELDEQTESLDAGTPQAYSRYLNSGDADEDLAHYHSLTRRLGVDLGAMVPFGDFANTFGIAPMLGLHMAWEAIPPFSFVVAWHRASTADKNNATNAKLTVNALSIGTTAAFPVKRFSPFVKLEAAFLFNDVNFNEATKLITKGNDLNITSFGVNAGIGIDFIVGREVSVGLDITYHYAVPKKLLLSDSSQFDLASPYVTTGLRLNF